MLKHKQKDARGSGLPFCMCRGCSAAVKVGAAYPHLQLLLAQFRQVAAPSQQQSVQIGEDAQLTTYTTVYPCYQQASFRCFSCRQTGHFQKACPLGATIKKDPSTK